jgi:hypothetical protein
MLALEYLHPPPSSPRSRFVRKIGMYAGGLPLSCSLVLLAVVSSNNLDIATVVPSTLLLLLLLPPLSSCKSSPQWTLASI